MIFHDFSMSDHPDPQLSTSCVRSSSELSPQIRRWRTQSGVLQQNLPRNHGFSRNSKQQSKHGSHSNIFPTCSNHGLLLLFHVEGNSHGTSWDKRDKPARAPTKNFMASTANLGDPGTPGTEPLWIWKTTTQISEGTTSTCSDSG